MDNISSRNQTSNFDTPQRLHWVDLVKGIAMFLVVWGHSGKAFYYYSSLYYVHLPIFIVVSGYLLGFSDKWKQKPLCHTVRKKAAEILFPYVIFGMLYIAFNFVKLVFFR